MTPEEAIRHVRAKWAHAPVDLRDVQERVALRERDHLGPSRIHLVAAPPAVRVFLRGGATEWTSRYLHRSQDFDRILDELQNLARPQDVGERGAR